MYSKTCLNNDVTFFVTMLLSCIDLTLFSTFCLEWRNLRHQLEPKGRKKFLLGIRGTEKNHKDLLYCFLGYRRSTWRHRGSAHSDGHHLRQARRGAQCCGPSRPSAGRPNSFRQRGVCHRQDLRASRPSYPAQSWVFTPTRRAQGRRYTSKGKRLAVW